MKLLWTSAGVVLLAGATLLSGMSGKQQPQALPLQHLALPMGSMTMLKSQASHIRPIDPFEIDIVPTTRPVPEGFPLGSVFGMRKHPILGVDKMHQGIDFPAPTGTPVLATAAGKVILAFSGADSSSFGNHIRIWHDEEYETLYAHLSELYVIENDIVSEGDTIGYVGNTGRSTNAHLHYEVIRDGVHVDPEDYL
ncbi:MAG: M23 family metallopeptidase [Bacteroidia bacterium]|nr:M23 family metallopeptidase [Bacteroidia bacterium]